MEKSMHGVDFIITGEGKLDGQTSMGKAPLGIAQLVQKHQYPSLHLQGGLQKRQLY